LFFDQTIPGNFPELKLKPKRFRGRLRMFQSTSNQIFGSNAHGHTFHIAKACINILARYGYAHIDV